MDLLSETVRLVRSSDRPLSEICKAARVTPRWFYMVESGEIADPSIVRIQRLYNYLKQHEAAA